MRILPSLPHALGGDAGSRAPEKIAGFLARLTLYTHNLERTCLAGDQQSYRDYDSMNGTASYYTGTD